MLGVSNGQTHLIGCWVGAGGSGGYNLQGNVTVYTGGAVEC